MNVLIDIDIATISFDKSHPFLPLLFSLVQPVDSNIMFVQFRPLLCCLGVFTGKRLSFFFWNNKCHAFLLLLCFFKFTFLHLRM